MNPLIPGAHRSYHQPLFPAGQAQASSLPQGGQWLVLAAIGGAFAFYWWGLQPETAEDKRAYQQHLARRAARR